MRYFANGSDKHTSVKRFRLSAAADKNPNKFKPNKSAWVMRPSPHLHLEQPVKQIRTKFFVFRLLPFAGGVGAQQANSHKEFDYFFIASPLPDATWTWACSLRITRLWHWPWSYCSPLQMRTIRFINYRRNKNFGTATARPESMQCGGCHKQGLEIIQGTGGAAVNHN